MPTKLRHCWGFITGNFNPFDNIVTSRAGKHTIVGNYNMCAWLLLYKVKKLPSYTWRTCGENTEEKKEKRTKAEKLWRVYVCLFLCILREWNGKRQHGIFIEIGINVHIHDGMLLNICRIVWSSCNMENIGYFIFRIIQ